MSLDSDRWGTNVAQALQGFTPPQDSFITQSDLENVWKIVKGQDVTEITGNAEVTSTVAVANVTGVTPGGGTSGPGTGTATGTVS